jgi:dTDP-4-dehydrorhamnose reductase
MNILITGAYGQLGNELRILSGKYSGWEFLFTDADTLDITDEERVARFLDEYKPGFVINCAAYTAVDQAESDTSGARRLNALAPGYLAKAAKKNGAGFLHVSTDYVFDGRGHLPYRELHPVHPLSVYGVTKREGEERSLAENEQTVIIRTSWLYSSFGHNFVKTMLRLGKERDELSVVFDQVGSPTYAADLAQAILDIASVYEKQREFYAPGIYHYANEGVASWFDFAKTIFEMADISCRVVPVLSDKFPAPARRPHFSVMDKTKIKEAFGLTIPYWKESLEICIQKLLNT